MTTLTERYRDQRVVVLGATGFIGRWLARYLSRSGAKLHVAVRDRATARGVFSNYEISATLWELDLGNFNELTSWIRELNVAVLFNLAGYGVDSNEGDERTAYAINAELVGVICEAMADARDREWTGQSIVHAGSAAEYGDAHGALSETSIERPVTTYGKSKLQGTRTLRECCIRSGMRGLTARLFTVYGPGEHPARLLPSLLEASRRGGRVLLTEGLQERDFTYVEDVAEGLLRLGLASAEPGAVVDLGTGRSSTVRDFVERAADELGISRDQLVFGAIGGGKHDTMQSPASTRRLLELTGWLPSTSIGEGVRRTRDFVRVKAREGT